MTPYYETPLGKLYHGNVSDVLLQLESESVQMCVTSPPYWGLRDYGNPPTIWDAKEGCDHVWGDEKIIKAEGLAGSGVGKIHMGSSCNPRDNGLILKYDASQGQFCQLCGAWLGCLGLEPTPELYTRHMVQVFREVKRVLRADGTLWLNLGDSYAGGGTGGHIDNKASVIEKAPSHNVVKTLKPKDLCGIPWRVAFALQADGWYLRQDIIWQKPNPMPESVKDRCTKAHEYMFLMSKNGRYFYDADAVKSKILNSSINRAKYPSAKRKEGVTVPATQKRWNVKEGVSWKETQSGYRNKRSVWTIPTQPYPAAHFATFPTTLIEPCIFAGSREGDIVLDPFFGAETTGLVCEKYNRKWIGIELSEPYAEIAAKRIESEASQLKLWG